MLRNPHAGGQNSGGFFQAVFQRRFYGVGKRNVLTIVLQSPASLVESTRQRNHQMYS